MLARGVAAAALRSGRCAVFRSAAEVDLAEAQLLRAGVFRALVGTASIFGASFPREPV